MRTVIRLIRFSIVSNTGLAQIWILMPTGRQYERFQIWSHSVGQPDLSEMVVPATTVDLPIGSIAIFQLINPKSNRLYECRWNGPMCHLTTSLTAVVA